MWTSSYYCPQYKRGPLVVDSIFTNIHNAVGRIEAKLRYLNGKDAQNKMDLHERQGSEPTLSNYKYFLVNERQVLLSPYP